MKLFIQTLKKGVGSLRLEEAFGVVLREYRKEKGFSQESLALTCEMDRTFISLLERGKRRPTINTVVEIASVLQVDADIIVRDVINYWKTDH